MSNDNNPFLRESLGDLGVGMQSTMTKEDVGSMLKSIAYSEDIKCICCGGKASYRLVPKHASLNTAEIQDKGFVCEHCLLTKVVSKADYGIKDL